MVPKNSVVGPVPYLAPLDGLRGILALWVFGFHILAISGVWEHLPAEVQRIMDGARAVDVFMILSGFVITHLLLHKRESYKLFIGRRFLRLYPAYIIAILIAIIAQAAGLMPLNYSETRIWTHFVAHVTMLHGAVPNTVLANASGAILNPAWSISLEWQFYVLAPFLIGIGSWRRFLIFAFAAIVSYRIVAQWLTAFDAAFLPLSLQLFWIGTAYAMAFNSKWMTPTIAKQGSLVVLLAGLLLLPYSANIGFIVWAAAMTLVARYDVPLGWPPLVALGTWSYTIYLIHETVIYVIKSWAVVYMSQGLALAFTVATISIPIVLLGSYLMHLWIERPMINLGKRLSST